MEGPGESPSAGKSRGNCSQRPAGNGSSGGDEAGDEEQEDSSSSSLLVNLTALHQQPPQEVLEDDLERFRRKWRQEVARASAGPAHAGPAEQQPPDTAASDLDKAVELYMAGMQLEQDGQLYEAIQQYRRAVQTDPAVEEVVRRLLVVRHRQGPRDGNGNVEDLGSEEEKEEEHEPAADDDQVDNALCRLQQLTLDGGRFCQPAVPQTGVHISSLPSEVMQLIIRWVVSSEVDVRSLELLSLVCRGLYVLCRDPAVWKRVCYRVLGPCCAEAGPLAGWRELYLSRPHLHFSGCYVGRASYIRSGELNGYQDTSYRPWHMVHYYRFLRFFPEGVLLMLTSAEEPAASVSQLMQRTPRHGPVISGHYRLKGDRVVAVLSKPRDAVRRVRPGRLRRRDKIQYDPGEQMLHIELEILPFKLTWQSYKIVTRYVNGQESTHIIDLNDQFPALHFSRVRSYTAVSEAPLR